MKKNVDISEYVSEADVETKYIYGILLDKVFKFSSNLVNFHVPVEITQGREKTIKEADVVIKDEKGENVIVIDSKAPCEKLENWFAQVDSYAAHLEAPISILSNYHRTIVRTYLDGNKKQIIFDKPIDFLLTDNFLSLKEVVLKRLEQLSLSSKANIVCENKENKTKITDYRRLFRQIHTKIRSIDKLDPTASFDEFSKVLFIKIINDVLEQKGDKLTVERINCYDNEKSKKFYINTWFKEKISEFYPGIFDSNETVNISSRTLCIALELLDKEFDLKDSMVDIKGRAFEEFLPSQLRGKGLGQFFTPRPIVDFMVDLADISITDKVLDFAAGSGGFLIKAFDKKSQLIKDVQKQYLDIIGKSRLDLLEEAKYQIFGIDAEKRAVRTAKMNMLLWGDGKQIQHGNGLDIKDNNNLPYYAKEYVSGNKETGVDIILANPPFGSKEEENQDILKRYELSGKKKSKDNPNQIVNKAEKTEHLFIEKAYKMLKPNGKLLIVLPEGIFSNKNSKIRDYVLSHFTVETIVKLPKHTFVMSGVDTINTVILSAKKNTVERESVIIKSDKNTWINKENIMSVNFVSVNQVGIEPSGKAIGLGYETSDLKLVADKLKQKDYKSILANPYEYAEIEFSDDTKSQNWKQSMVKFIRKDFISVPKRLDPTFYFFNEETKNILKTYTTLDIKAENIKKIKLTEEELNNDIEKNYKYVSVVKNIKGNITETEEKTVADILTTKELPQKLFKGDIVFNPYRINTGSIIVVDLDEDNLVTSPLYVILRGLNINAEYFVQLLKTPFIKYQIQVLASGSVRDSFSAEDLKLLKLPKISILEQAKVMKEIESNIEQIDKYNSKINENIENINKVLIKKS